MPAGMKERASAAVAALCAMLPKLEQQGTYATDTSMKDKVNIGMKEKKNRAGLRSFTVMVFDSLQPIAAGDGLRRRRTSAAREVLNARAKLRRCAERVTPCNLANSLHTVGRQDFERISRRRYVPIYWF